MSSLENQFNQSENVNERDIFVPVEEEDIFLKKHNLQRVVLPNGARIITVNSPTDEYADAQVKYQFERTGAFYDPSEYLGISHLLEHLICNRFDKVTSQSDAYSNGGTSLSYIYYYVRGIANKSDLFYGLYPSLASMHNALFTPLGITLHDLEIEKEIVKAEIELAKSDSTVLLNNAFYRAILLPNNPICKNIFGTNETLDRITLQDIVSLQLQNTTANNLLIQVANHGSEANFNLLCELVAKHTSTIPISQRNTNIAITSEYDLFKPEVIPGNTLFEDTNVRNKSRELSLIWLTPLNNYSTGSFAMSIFIDHFFTKWFSLIRANGLGYDTRALDEDFYEKNVVGFRMDIPYQKNPNKIVIDYKNLLMKSLTQFTEKDASDILERLERRRRNTPISRYDIFETIVTGLRKYNRVINTDKIRQLKSQITIPDIMAARLKLIENDCLAIVTGDLNRHRKRI